MISNDSPNSVFRFSIAATFTADPLQPIIEFWGHEVGEVYDVQFAPYNQVEQALLDPNGAFVTNSHGVNVVAIRIEDFGSEAARIVSNVEHLVETLSSRHFSVPLLVCLCPPSSASRASTPKELGDRIRKSVPAGRFLHFDEIQDLYPVDDYEAAGGGRLGHIPYNETYYAALGTAIVRRAHALGRAPYKVIAVDCDNTLWTGICGEDGPTGVVIDEPRRRLQQFLVAQREAGMLLTIASKNNEADALEVFERNPNMPVRLKDFAAWRIDWESKADNLSALARELNLGLDTFILIDDSAKECAEVETGAPEALTVPLPAELEEIGHFLRHLWAFDHPVVTDEDRRRPASYVQTRRFDAEMRRTSSLEQFMAGLQLDVRIEKLNPERLPRVAQLTQRTNQFNFTGVRRSEAELQTLLAGGLHECFTVEVSDRFGDYGLVGAMILARDFAIDTFLLSCRVLGRGVEHRMLAFLSELRPGTVIARLKPTGRNTPARQFLESIGRAGQTEANGDLSFRFAADSIRGLRWKPASTVANPISQPVPVKRETTDYVRIARTLSTPEQIRAAIRDQNRVAPAVDSLSTDTERRLAELWADLLHVPVTSPEDNFFDLGGHSLLAVLLLVRVQESFGVELSIDDVYSGAITLSSMAKRIDTLQAGGPDSSEYAEILREIEEMSDEEARRILAETESEGGRP